MRTVLPGEVLVNTVNLTSIRDELQIRIGEAN